MNNFNSLRDNALRMMSAQNEDANAVAQERIKIAIQKKGRLFEDSIQLLKQCGLTWDILGDELYCKGKNAPIDLLLVRDDDIPQLLQDGICQLGIVGKNIYQEFEIETQAKNSSNALPISQNQIAIGTSLCKLMIAIPQNRVWQGINSLQGLRIATSHPYILQQWLTENQIQAQIVCLSGSIEIAPKLGQADVICDLVSTGATLKANQLKAVECILQSEALVAFQYQNLSEIQKEILTAINNRIEGVIKMRKSRLLMFQSDKKQVDRLLEMIGNEQAPTLMPLQDSERIAIQVVCQSELGWSKLEALKNAGASQLMVLPVERMLA